MPRKGQTIYVQEKEVKTMKTFEYLGSLFDGSGGAKKDVNNRVKKPDMSVEADRWEGEKNIIQLWLYSNLLLRRHKLYDERSSYVVDNERTRNAQKFCKTVMWLAQPVVYIQSKH